MTWQKALSLPLVAIIRVYQIVISPMSPPSCIYYPSCSAYAVTALQRFGPIKGSWLAARRLLRCHPWAAGGVDHVPERTPGVRAQVGNPADGETLNSSAHDACVDTPARHQSS